MRKGSHSCIEYVEKTFPISDDPQLRRAFNKIVSYLAHWSKVLGFSFDSNAEFLPNFIIPFVRFHKTNLLMCFEVIATILLNQCQLWFEFTPLPPINYLGIIENLLNYFDPSLIAFYRRYSTTNLIFAWHILQTSFTETLDELQWFQLWDHIISQPSYFLIFIVVAFNLVQCSAIQRLKTANEIERFFHEPSNINVNILIRKSHEIMEKCPFQLHPMQYMHNFIELNAANGQYQKILNYPINIFNKQIKCIDEIQLQSQVINRKYMELEQFEMDLMQQLVDRVHMDENQRRMQNVELEQELAVLNELKRIEQQRQHLILYERQINNRAVLMAQILVENETKNAYNNRHNHLRKTLDTIERQVDNIFHCGFSVCFFLVLI